MKSDYLAPIIKFLIFATICLTVVNDIGGVVSTHYYIGDETRGVAQEALRNYNLYDRSPDQALAGAKLKAEQDGAVLTGFQVTRKVIRVSVLIPAKNTWLAHRISGLKPYLQAEGQYDIPLNSR